MTALRWIIAAPVALAFFVAMWLAPHDCGGGR